MREMKTVQFGKFRVNPGATAIFFAAASEPMPEVAAGQQTKHRFVKFVPKVLVIPREFLEHVRVNSFKLGGWTHPEYVFDAGEQDWSREPKPELAISGIVLDPGEPSSRAEGDDGYGKVGMSLSVTSISGEACEFYATVVGEVESS